MSPTLFNVVVDSVVRHWKYLMSEGADKDDISGDKAEHLARRMLRAHDEV